MKFKYLLVLLSLIAWRMCAPFESEAQAATLPYSIYATGGTASGATNNWAIIGAYANVANATPVLTFLSATAAAGDTAAGVVQFYSCTNSTYATAVNTTTTNTVNSTNGWDVGDVVVVRHLANDNYERRYVSAIQATNQIVLTQATTTAVAAGDLFYKEKTAGTIPITSCTNGISGPGIYSGQPNLPMLIQVVGTNTSTLNAACARFVQ